MIGFNMNCKKIPKIINTITVFVTAKRTAQTADRRNEKAPETRTLFPDFYLQFDYGEFRRVAVYV